MGFVGRHSQQKRIVEQPNDLDVRLGRRHRNHHRVEVANDQLLDQRFRLRLAQFDDEIRIAEMQKRQQFGQQIGPERRNDAELQLAFEQPAAMTGEVNEVAGGGQHLIAPLGHQKAEFSQRRVHGRSPVSGPSSCHSRFLDRAATELLQAASRRTSAQRVQASRGVSAQGRGPLTNRERYRAERQSSHAIFRLARVRADESAGIEWLASAGSRGSQSYLGPCAKHPLPLRQQAMTMHLSRRDEHRVMEAMADMSLVTKGQQPARANGDCGVGGVNSIPEGGEKAVEPAPESIDARQLARRNSSDGHFDLDE
ncbi:MAG: hypothetical protein WA397_15655 [Roseiarcus sp.]